MGNGYGPWFALVCLLGFLIWPVSQSGWWWPLTLLGGLAAAGCIAVGVYVIQMKTHWWDK